MRKASQVLSNHKNGRKTREKLASEALRHPSNLIYYKNAKKAVQALKTLIDNHRCRETKKDSKRRGEALFTDERLLLLEKNFMYKLDKRPHTPKIQMVNYCLRSERDRLNYKPFRAKCAEIQNNLKEISLIWDIPEKLLKQVVHKLEVQVLKSNLIWYTIPYICQVHYMDYGDKLMECLRYYFEPMLMD